MFPDRQVVCEPRQPIGDVSRLLFQFNGNLYEQVDGVAMGSPLGPLMANTFMCSVEEKLARENRLTSFYKSYMDDTLALVRDLSEANDLLTRLNEAHPSIQFTMEVAIDGRLPLTGMEIIKIDGSLETHVYRKKTNKGLLLHYQAMLTPGTNGHC